MKSRLRKKYIFEQVINKIYKMRRFDLLQLSVRD